MSKSTIILGISCYYHDSAAALLRDGEIVFAAHEERYTRKKHDDGFPVHAVCHAVAQAGITIEDIDAVVFYEKPIRKFFERILETQLRVWPRGFTMYHRAMQEWMTKKLWIREEIQRELGVRTPILFTSHHQAHAASAFFCSGFDEAAVITVDGVGELATTTIGYGQGKKLMMLEELRFPHSLGLLYSAFTYYLGFKVNSAEYKVMGLAPYGKPIYMDQMRTIVQVHDDGSFALNMRYFTYEYGLTMTGGAMERLFGQPTRSPESPLTQFHKNVAASLQLITEELMLGIVRRAKERTKAKNLCLAGGVALNCVANGKILKSRLFDDLFIQPAAGDAGGALGAALAVWHEKYEGKRLPRLENVFLGTAYSDEEIGALLAAEQLPYEKIEASRLSDRIAELLEGENVIGWFQGRMEFGPRSLGSRSILADPRRRENWQKVNLKIKFRESFRPFAPTVLAERSKEYFDLHCESPYMLLVADVLPHKRVEIPAVTHVDGSARIQTIRRDQHPQYYDLLKAFERRTGCSVLINTSFNVRGEPIVESPMDALCCFLNTDMDWLVLGTCLLDKRKMPVHRLKGREGYLDGFALD